MRTIDLDSLTIFQTVVAEGGVIRAAEKLHRVPSNITTRIKQLEEFLGVRLFRKEGRTLGLSSDGKTLLKYSTQLLRLADEAVNELRTGKPQGVFRLGSLESTAGSRLAPVLSCYHSDNPDVVVELVTGTTGVLLNRIANFEIEAAFVSEPFTAPDFESLPVFTEELVLITSKAIGVVKSPMDLGRATMIAFAHGCSYRKRLEEWLGGKNVMPERALEFSSYQGMIACVAAGTGFAIVPKSLLTSLNAMDKVSQHHLPDGIAVNRTHLVWKGIPSLALRALINQMKHQVEAVSPATCQPGNFIVRSAELPERRSNTGIEAVLRGVPPMPDCTAGLMSFGRMGRCQIEANFEGGALSSDGGLMLLREVDRRIGLSKAAAGALHDPRNRDMIVHEMRDLVAQRLYALCCGYEDLNDHAALRRDPLMQTAVGRSEELGSSPTLCRLEKRATRSDGVALNRVLVEQFIASQPRVPEELILDVDASDIPLHGDQEQKEFHAYYDSHCYLPLYVFCGKAMLACVLRRSRIDGARHAAAVIKLIVSRLRQAWPQVRIIVRGDSGFCRQRLIRWCERQDVGYVIGLARNARLHRQVEGWERLMEHAYTASGTKQQLIREFSYAAQSWDRPRRVVTRLEFGSQGSNPRFIVSNLDGAPSDLYDAIYCQRGEAENRIKETQLDLFGTRASCHRFLANWLRVMFSALAYTLMQRLRELALANTELAKASAATIRVRLLKIGAAVLRNTRRIRILLASHHPLRDVYFVAANALASP